jgi:hypothetical protein
MRCVTLGTTLGSARPGSSGAPTTAATGIPKPVGIRMRHLDLAEPPRLRDQHPPDLWVPEIAS